MLLAMLSVCLCQIQERSHGCADLLQAANVVPLVFRVDEGSSSSAYLERLWLFVRTSQSVFSYISQTISLIESFRQVHFALGRKPASMCQLLLARLSVCPCQVHVRSQGSDELLQVANDWAFPESPIHARFRIFHLEENMAAPEGIPCAPRNSHV